MPGFDEYGKQLLAEVSDGEFQHWHNRADRSIVYPPGGMTAEVDGVIDPDIAVEISAVNEKQLRAAILDLAMHPFPRKLLIVNLGGWTNKRRDAQTLQATCELLLQRLASLQSSLSTRCVVAVVSGVDREKDAASLRACLRMVKNRQPGTRPT